MPDIPSFVGPAAGGVLAIALFVITSQRADIRDLADRRASEDDWRSQRAKARVVLASATVLLAGVAFIAVPALADLIDGEGPTGAEWVAIAALAAGISLWPFAAGNVRVAAAHLTAHRRRLYGG